MFSAVALASRLTCQAGGSVLSHLSSAAVQALTFHTVFGVKEEALVCSKSSGLSGVLRKVSLNS